MNQANTEPLEPETVESEQILVVPGYLFFIESVALPEGLDADEQDDFAELSLESIAPFPIEHLFWGYLYAKENDAILLYAAHRDRISGAGYTDLENYVWVLPDFATLIGACFPEDTEVLLEGDSALTRLYFAKGAEQPGEVVSERHEDAIKATIERVRKQGHAKNSSGKSMHISSSSAIIDHQEQCILSFEPSDSRSADRDFGKWTELRPDDAALWAADIRSPGFKQGERKNRRTSALLLKLAGYAAMFAVFLIVLELLLVGGNLWQRSLDTKIASRDPAVRTIEDKQSLMNKLEQVAQNELQPIAILRAMNNVRLDKKLGIHFTEASVEGENKVTIEGVARTINELNRYTEILQGSGSFSLLGQPKYMTRSGETTFTLSFSYDAPTQPDTVEPSESLDAGDASEELSQTEPEVQ